MRVAMLIYASRRKSGGRKQKKVWKERKKYLTNEKVCDKLNKLRDESRKPGAQRTAQKNLKKLVKSAWQIRQDVLR